MLPKYFWQITIIIFLIYSNLWANSEASFHLNRHNYKFDLLSQFQSVNIDTEASSNTNAGESSISLNNLIFQGTLFLFSNLSFSLNYSSILFSDTSLQGSGFGGSLNYYFVGGEIERLQSDSNFVEIWNKYNIYAFIGGINRDFNFSNVNLNFVGYSTGVGGEYKFDKSNYYLKSIFSYEILQNSAVRTLTSSSIAIGIGLDF